MRRDADYLRDILTASEAVARFLAGVDRVAFPADELRQDAVARRLTIVGEAAGRLSAELRTRAKGVDWPRVVAFRNLVVHSYFAIDWAIVWSVATTDLPELATRIRALEGPLVGEG
jgi:uncharacterized protein with HEPN domain